ncbi:RtcB family protein [Bacteroides xylanisolvens]|uniref:RtcB family protein n=1 Tax=Bacteroides xylanisolvens TaxID=371601 RepID=UPI001C031C89|nr:RtcB family protein [Bacteroides xylanisolvens]MBT9861447.1 RtcB family protein [Bacteroides xylanisolvens]
MEKVIMGTRLPAKFWLNEVEDSCMSQIMDLTSLPFAFKHIAIMPDAHAGKGMPIGGVLATKGVIVPNAVGVDIGCGMCAIKTNRKAEDFSYTDLTSIMSKIRATIPLGFDHHTKKQDQELLPQGFDLEEMPILKNQYEACLKQIGTLGGGNHFIEIQKDTETSDVWVMIHSGSRNIGLKVANHYNKIAQYWNEKWYSEMVSGLAYLPMETQMAKDYFREMNYCVAFAFANRQLMMTRICEAIQAVKPETDFEPMINIAHNYAAWENHFDQDVIVHRKGATRAYEGEIGIIPGSMGTKSYIVEGLGNPESFKSCSHGAGRLMGRKDACRRLSLDEEKERMNQQGIIHGLRSQDELDEAPGAYKDIAQVIANERDLVKPLVELAPMAVIKR